jgi:hypothetical protein
MRVIADIQLLMAQAVAREQIHHQPPLLNAHLKPVSPRLIDTQAFRQGRHGPCKDTPPQSTSSSLFPDHNDTSP